MTYAERLKDPRWQRKRLEILQRDGWACRQCESKHKTLHVHHNFYDGRQPWDYPNDTLFTLCEDCHARVTLGSKILRDALAQLHNVDPSSDGFRISGYVQAMAWDRRHSSAFFDKELRTAVEAETVALKDSEQIRGICDYFGVFCWFGDDIASSEGWRPRFKSFKDRGEIDQKAARDRIIAERAA